MLVVPLVTLIVGTHWSCDRRDVEPSSMLLVEDRPRGPQPARRYDARLRFLVDGAAIYTGQYLENRHLDLRLDEPLGRFSLTLQSESDHSFRVSGSHDGQSFAPLWDAPSRSGVGAISRSSPVLEPTPPVRQLRISPLDGDGKFIITGFKIHLSPHIVPHWVLIPALWGSALALLGLAGLGTLKLLSNRLFDLWRRADPWLSAALLYLVCFRLSAAVVLSVLFLLLCSAVLYWINRAPRSAALVALVALLLTTLGPAALTRLVVSKVAQTHELNVDHRLKPNPRKLINSDGIRSREEATEFQSEDFVILFLGDSFTYGVLLGYDQAYPYQFERIVESYACNARVRAVNFGWTSSSPLLSLRLLREVGYKYKPDLVLYNLDMTDFQDDLEYEELLVRGGDLSFDPSRVVDRFVKTRLPWLDLDLQLPSAARELLRFAPETDLTTPDDRFFATNQPLEESRERIERGVMKNLASLYEFSAEVLETPMALIVYPRAYQYAPKESPDNWERDAYSVLGPFAKEPFRYFEEVRDELPYPLLNLLSDFENAEEFPLHLRGDPHWNAAGARVMAQAVARSLVTRELIPCRRARTGEGTETR